MWDQLTLFGTQNAGGQPTPPWVARVNVGYVTSRGDLRVMTAAFAGRAARMELYDKIVRFVRQLAKLYRRPTQSELFAMDKQLRLRGF